MSVRPSTGRWPGRLTLLVSVALAACTQHFTPLQNRIVVGKESYVVFVADGEGGQGDLFAMDAFGGNAYPFTYSLADESHPALDPTGVLLAFIRSTSDTDRASRKVWVMDLLNGRETDLPLDRGVVPEQVGWSRGGATIYVGTSNGMWALAAPPASPTPHRLTGLDSLAADSALAVLVGNPPFARVDQCRPGADAICAFAGAAPPTPVDSPAHHPFRWGSDSLGYFVGERLLVRPVGPGRPREVRIERAPDHPHEATWFGGLTDPNAAQ
ncbi:MAG: TolB family protein [Gemmatimonadales bacterium]